MFKKGNGSKVANAIKLRKINRESQLSVVLLCRNIGILIYSYKTDENILSFF